MAEPEAHSQTAQAYGIPVAGAGGLFDISWVPLGSTASTVCVGNDSRLSDARTPTAHATSHKNGGSDEVATATAAANAIPKAGAGGTLAKEWFPQGTAVADATDAASVILRLNELLAQCRLGKGAYIAT